MHHRSTTTTLTVGAAAILLGAAGFAALPAHAADARMAKKAISTLSAPPTPTDMELKISDFKFQLSF
jgi:hypothetical protein